MQVIGHHPEVFRRSLEESVLNEEPEARAERRTAMLQAKDALTPGERLELEMLLKVRWAALRVMP